MTRSIKWEINTAKHSSGKICKIGKVKVGSIFQPSRQRDDPAFWRASIELPGIVMKEGTTDFATEAEAMVRVESAIATWFKWLDVEE